MNTPSCDYCGKCVPCPMGLQIPDIIRLIDRADSGDEGARAEYEKLTGPAGLCIICGRCKGICPRGFDSVSRIREARNYFGK